MPRCRSWTSYALVLTFVLPLTRGQPASAATGEVNCSQDDACREHFKQASEYYKVKNYVEALLEFRTAYARRPEPRILLNLGRTLFKMGRPKEAIDYYQRFQTAAPNDSASQETVNKYLEEARAALLPPAEVEPKKEPAIPAEPEPPPQSPPEPPSAATPVPPALTLAASVRPPAATAPPPRPIYKKWWLWTLIGVSVAGGVTGLVVGTYRRPGSANADVEGVPAFRPF